MLSVFSAAPAGRASASATIMVSTILMRLLLVERSAELRNDFVAEHSKGLEDLRQRRPGGMPETDQEIVGPHLLVPQADPVDAVLRRSQDEAIERDALQGEVRFLLNVLVVRLVPPVIAVRAQHARLVLADGLLAGGGDEALAEHDDLRGLAPAFGRGPVQLHSPLEPPRELKGIAQKGVGHAARALH